jgi:CO dehydrogenase maturation factor
MPLTIAIAGKGGVGKSTIAALVIRWLNEHGRRSVLAVDADANVNLNDLLGVEVAEAVGAVREELKEKINALPGGMTKQQFLEHKIHQGLVETRNFDLIVMGRPEGPGCYCYANNLLREILKTLADNYQYVVIDNEAGMEHLSRRTTQKIDHLLIVSDPSVRGVQTAGRIGRLLKELDTRVKHKGLLINRARGELSEAVRAQVSVEGLELLGVLPEDDTVLTRDEQGSPAYDTPANSALYQAINHLLSRLIRGVGAASVSPNSD